MIARAEHSIDYDDFGLANRRDSFYLFSKFIYVPELMFANVCLRLDIPEYIEIHSYRIACSLRYLCKTDSSFSQNREVFLRHFKMQWSEVISSDTVTNAQITRETTINGFKENVLFFITVEDSVSYVRQTQYCIYRSSSTRMARIEDGREIGSDARNC